MLLRELFEAPKTAVFAFGRMNPPTIGHKKLADTVAAQKGDPFIFLSQSQKPKTDPLDFPTKLKLAQAFFPNVKVGDANVKTIIQALQKVEAMGYTDIIYVAGSDRIEDFTTLINKYNGKEYNFNSIKVVSAGERDPDADGAEGMSASKMRAAAASSDFEAFVQGVPDKKLAQTMYDAVRNGMGVKDAETVEAQGENPAKTKAHLAYLKKHPKYTTGPEKDYEDKEAKRVKGRKSKYDTQMSLNLEDVSPEDEDEFHTMLDKLVHKYFGHSSDEKKAKKKEVDEILGFATKNPKRATIKKKRPPEEDSVKDKLAKRRAMAAKGNPDAYKTGAVKEGDLVLDQGKLRSFIINMISDKIEKTDDIELLAKWLKMIVGKELSARGNRYQISAEDVVEAYNSYKEDAPPGREKQVKKLKKKFDDPGAPYAIAWAQHNKHGKPKK